MSDLGPCTETLNSSWIFSNNCWPLIMEVLLLSLLDDWKQTHSYNGTSVSVTFWTSRGGNAAQKSLWTPLYGHSVLTNALLLEKSLKILKYPDQETRRDKAKLHWCCWNHWVLPIPGFHQELCSIWSSSWYGQCIAANTQAAAAGF